MPLIRHSSKRILAHNSSWQKAEEEQVETAADQKTK